ncbi:MAG: phytanoyl-CoA dioxygenase family protein [Actinomycetota bacterium]|nr:phytanoyl-CoA dioxygenase family protein [Actinomycetota bacterium]
MSVTTDRDLASPWLSEVDCSVDELRALIATETRLPDYPHAVEVSHNVPVYDSRQLRHAMATVASRGGRSGRARQMLQAELARALSDGPGIVVLAGAFEADVVDRASSVFDDMISEQRASGADVGDHFAKPGANDRVWNALEKLAVADPDVFVDYYANDMLAVVSAAWLGPGYQVTSQVNVVNPGGAGQTMHRDYHLGFCENEVVAQYPAHVHRLSQFLTLQGAVAHCEMPVESGPTLYLPHSQKLLSGYLAWRLPRFHDLFETDGVQLPLAKGDAVFFNPALFHAAGSNHTADIRRMANLLQVSSAFGRAMETVDRARTTAAIFPALQQRRAAGMDAAALRNALASAAEAYAFPTNLDLDQPVGGLAPQTQAELAWEALEQEWKPPQLDERLRAYAARRRTHE